MTYDELSLLPQKYHTDEVKARAQRNSRSYRRVQDILRMAGYCAARDIIEEAHRLRRWSRGVNLLKFQRLIEHITGEPLCW